jgi:hypothetical protein
VAADKYKQIFIMNLKLLLLVVPFMLLALVVSSSQKTRKFIAANLAVIMLGMTLLCVLAYLVNGCCYVFVAGYYDHLEPSVVTIVRLLDDGKPVYHDVSSASRYSLLYGPNCFIFPYLAIKVFGDSVVSFKLLSGLFEVGSLLLVFLAIRSSTVSSNARCAGLIYFCGASLLFWDKLVWVRGDPQLLFWMALGLWAATRKTSLISFIVMGIAAGACINVKVHGIFYFAPVVALAMNKGHWVQWGAFVFTVVVVVAAPFLLIPEVNFSNYLLWLKMASKHGVGFAEMFNLLVLACYLLMPLALVAGEKFFAFPSEGQQGLLRGHTIQWATAILGVAAVIAVASKKGAGESHLMPLTPLGAWWIAFLLDKVADNPSTPAYKVPWRTVMAAFIALAVCNSMKTLAKAVVTYKHDRESLFVKVMDDTRNVALKFHGQTIAMGCGSNSTYEMTFARTELPLTGEFVLDTGALMDMQQSGLALPQATLDAFANGAVKIWLVPKDNVPFSFRSFYSNQDLFGEDLRRVFNEHYKKIAQSAYFDIWTFDH